MPEIGITNLLYRGARMDVKASAKAITIALKDTPADPVRIELAGRWSRAGVTASSFALDKSGEYRFERVSER